MPDAASRDDMTRRVLILGQLDGYANGKSAVAVQHFLESRGHDAQIVDTYHLSRAGATGRRRRLPGRRPRQWLLFAVEGCLGVLAKVRGPLRRRLTYPLLLAELRLRASLLRRLLSFTGIDLVVCETPHDTGVLAECPAPALYHCPTPWADELLLEDRLTASQHRRMRRRETALFEAVDHLAFHWHTYAQYALREYRISGHNLIELDWGCDPVDGQASYAQPTRVVYMGSLSSRFIDLPLLARLARQVDIDVYGGPPPDPAYGLRFRGWAPPQVLADYQFGLITCTDDPLRRSGFSAKHLQYFAYGLPVLLPKWRDDPALAEGSVPYDEDSFAEAVAAASAPEAWPALSEAALRQADRYSWDNRLDALDRLLRGE